MCLGIPGRIVEVWTADSGAPMAPVEFPEETKSVCLAHLPDLRIGDYTVIHAGSALTRIDHESAMATMREYGVLGAGVATESGALR